MKIESVETYVVHNWTFVRVRTDTGVEGVGESTFFGFPEATAAIIKRFAPKLRGEDPLRVEYHWLNLYRTFSMRGMGIGGAISAIDQALWDIRGKHFSAPVWQLLGGRVRDRVRAMLVINYGSIDAVVAECRDAVARGYTALKILLYAARCAAQGPGRSVRRDPRRRRLGNRPRHRTATWCRASRSR